MNSLRRHGVRDRTGGVAGCRTAEDGPGSAPTVDVDEPQQLERLRRRLRSLNRAVARRRSQRWILTLWSRYIRERDLGRCLICGSCNGVQAHHIIRRSLCSDVAYELGNGISLCRDCHSEVHVEFNGRPDLGFPLGEQGGDDQVVWARFFEALCVHAKENELDHDEFFSLSDHFLAFTVNCQGLCRQVQRLEAGDISRLLFALLVWSRMPITSSGNMLTSVVRANL